MAAAPQGNQRDGGMMENTELGRLILKQAEAFPESFSMETWGDATDCGTVACLGGYAMLMSGYRLLDEPEHYQRILATGRGGWYARPDESIVHGMYGEEAQRLLGMTHAERFGDGEPDDIFTDVHNGLARFRALLEGE